uniref:Uncharacterized protein n=1 Tax=Nelumbo nucifera TaxID=4432 RepID=A0A822ZW66_NELNU|nr:TPA_asm: hypothetical protein HUJ06_004398 [Nelumbo nucifera]
MVHPVPDHTQLIESSVQKLMAWLSCTRPYWLVEMY